MTFEYQSQVKVSVDFSPDLARLSGLRSDETYVSGEDVISEREPNLSSNIHFVYVYCDLLEHVPVGDTKAPFLRIVDKSTDLEGNVHRVFNPTLNVPLQKKCFDTVEINMMIDTGDPVLFLSGTSFVVLSFVASYIRTLQYKATPDSNRRHLTFGRRDERKEYCCDASRNLYCDYYSRQSGGKMPVFSGARIQRGHGLGSILGGFFRRLVLPFVTNNARNVLMNAVKTGMEVADDVLEGRSFKESAKRRVPAGIKRTV